MDKKLALEKCRQLCSQREYCAYDIEEKLLKWAIPLTYHKEIIKTLFTEKFLDHSRYLPAYINDKLNFNHWGKVKIKYHLKNKRIPESELMQYLNEIDDTSYTAILRDEIYKKRKTTKGKNEFEINQKIARFAISKGFEPNLVFEILKFD